MSSTRQILNICLIPDTNNPIGIKFKKHAIELSKKLNQEAPSLYELCDKVAIRDIDSLPHCTLMHINVNFSSQELAIFVKRLEPIMQQVITIKVNGVETAQASIFERDSLLIGSSDRPQATVKWYAVEKDKSLLKLQEMCVQAINNLDACITGRKEKYNPHFTLWVRKEYFDRNEPQIKTEHNHASFFVPCRVIVGTCGPIGQVTQQVSPQQLTSKL